MTDTKTKQQPKLSVIRKGRWRAIVGAPEHYKWLDPQPRYLGNERWISAETYVSAEECEQRNIDDINWTRAGKLPGSYVHTFIGPVFFPEEGEQ